MTRLSWLSRLVLAALSVTLLTICGAGAQGAIAATHSTAKAMAGGRPKVAAPPALLTATGLLSAAGLAAALHTSGLQDNGGVTETQPGGTAFVSSAVTATSDADLTVTVSSYRTGAAAQQGYKAVVAQLPSGSTSVLSGVGEQATTSDPLIDLKGFNCLNPSGDASEICPEVLGADAQAAAGAVVVMQGSQVLEVTTTPDPALVTQAESDVRSGQSTAAVALLEPPAATESESAADSWSLTSQGKRQQVPTSRFPPTASIPVPFRRPRSM